MRSEDLLMSAFSTFSPALTKHRRIGNPIPTHRRPPPVLGYAKKEGQTAR
jgi:hypothetical protein